MESNPSHYFLSEPVERMRRNLLFAGTIFGLKLLEVDILSLEETSIIYAQMIQDMKSKLLDFLILIYLSYLFFHFLLSAKDDVYAKFIRKGYFTPNFRGFEESLYKIMIRTDNHHATVFEGDVNKLNEMKNQLDSSFKYFFEFKKKYFNSIKIRFYVFEMGIPCILFIFLFYFYSRELAILMLPSHFYAMIATVIALIIVVFISLFLWGFPPLMRLLSLPRKKHFKQKRKIMVLGL